MQHDIAPILSKYEGQDAETVLSSPTLERDIAYIGNVINQSKDDETVENARDFLKTLMGHINERIESLKAEQDMTKESMETIEKMSEACIAYMKPVGSNKG